MSAPVVVNQPGVRHEDTSGNPVAVKDTDTITPANQPVIPVAGVDGTTARTLRVDSGGRAKVQADALPLPAGAATQTTLATLLTQVTGAAIQVALEAIKDTDGVKKITDALPVGDNVIGQVKVTDGTDVADVSVDRHADQGLRVSMVPVEFVRLICALQNIEQQLKQVVQQLELMTDENSKEIRHAD